MNKNKEEKTVKDLTNSTIDRQNILNNEIAILEIKKTAGIKGVLFEDKIVFTKEMISEFYGVEVRTINRYIEKFSDELKNNGYEVLRGKKLKKFIDALENSFGKDTTRINERKYFGMVKIVCPCLFFDV